jgi:hypothetical protein
MTEIVVNHNNTNYHLQFREVYAGDSANRYELTAGAKTILLERRKAEKTFGKRWKILSVNWQFKDTKTAAEFLNQIMIKIDTDIDGEKLSSNFRPGK